MSAADRREELEAAIWQAVTWAIRNADKPSSNRLEGHVRDAMARSGAYAEAVAGERIARMTSDQLARLAEIRRRGEQATAEAAARRTP